MKLYTVAYFLLTSLLSFAQEKDSISLPSLTNGDSALQLLPSVFKPDLFLMEYDQTTVVMDTVPNCAQLFKANGLLYWYQSKTKDPYCGVCFVRNNGDKSNIIARRSEYLVDNLWLNDLNITIVSNYYNGKRDGERLYLKREGTRLSKWKVELYDAGELVHTRFYD